MKDKILEIKKFPKIFQKNPQKFSKNATKEFKNYQKIPKILKVSNSLHRTWRPKPFWALVRFAIQILH